jgi:hypothetical protein
MPYHLLQRGVRVHAEAAAMRLSAPLLVLLVIATAAAAGGPAMAGLLGPGPGITGNDTGGIIPYDPAVNRIYRRLAADHCARWGRFAHITSVHRRYGEYIAFVCIDKPWVIH